MKPEDFLPTREVQLHSLEPNMVIGETFRYDQKSGAPLAAEVGLVLTEHIIDILRDHRKYPNVTREDGRSREAPIRILVFDSAQQEKDIMRDLQEDIQSAERMSPLVKKVRDGQIALMRSIDERVKAFATEFASFEDELQKETFRHRQLRAFLFSEEVRQQVYDRFLVPLNEDPVLNVYFTYFPNSRERGLDVASLAGAICVLAGIDPYPAVMGGLLNNIGEDVLRVKHPEGSPTYRSLYPYRDLALVDRILRPGGEIVDSLTADIIEAIKHRETDRVGRIVEKESDGGRVVVSAYIGNGMRHRDYFSPDRRVEAKLDEFKRELVRRKFSPANVEEVPTIYNEPIHLAIAFLEMVSQGRTRLNVLNACKKLYASRGLCAGEDLTIALLNVAGKKYFKQQPT